MDRSDSPSILNTSLVVADDFLTASSNFSGAATSIDQSLIEIEIPSTLNDAESNSDSESTTKEKVLQQAEEIAEKNAVHLAEQEDDDDGDKADSCARTRLVLMEHCEGNGANTEVLADLLDQKGLQPSVTSTNKSETSAVDDKPSDSALKQPISITTSTVAYSNAQSTQDTQASSGSGSSGIGSNLLVKAESHDEKSSQDEKKQNDNNATAPDRDHDEVDADSISITKKTSFFYKSCCRVL